MKRLNNFIVEEKLTAAMPVIEDGAILLYDVYVRGEWIGSRRLMKQCVEACVSHGVILIK